MTTEEQLVLDIINKAQEGRVQPFRPIVCWEEFRYYGRLARSNKLIIKTLKISADGLFTEYCQDVIDGTSNVNMLLAYRQLLEIKEFYEKDLEVIKQMLDDYDKYLGDHFWYSFFGGRREL